MRDRRRGVRVIRGGLILAGLLAGCGGSDGSSTGPSVASSIQLGPANPYLQQGLTAQLTATVLDGQGRAMPGANLTFSSSDSSIVEVSPTGLLTSPGLLGAVVVKAYSGGIQSSLVVSVTQRGVAVVFYPDTVSVAPNQTAHLSAGVVDYMGDFMPSEFVTLTSLDPSVATVDQYGWVTAGSSLGTGRIQVAWQTLADTAAVVVLP